MNVLGLIPGMTGGSEILLIVFAILLLFGGKKLPELARSLGKCVSEFKRGQTEPVHESKKLTDESKEKMDEKRDA